MRKELLVGTRNRRDDAAGSTQCVDSSRKEEKDTQEGGGMQPLPLAFPTASWSSYHPSDLESSYSDSSCKSLHSGTYSHTSESTYEDLSLSPDNDGSPRQSTILSLRGTDTRQLPYGKTTQLKSRCAFGKYPKHWRPWRLGASRENQIPERANAMLYLALTDPVLSTSVLLATDGRTPRSLSEKEESAKESTVVSLSTLLGLACILAFVAFALGFAIGCSLVRPRPSRGAAIIAAFPLASRFADASRETEDFFASSLCNRTTQSLGHLVKHERKITHDTDETPARGYVEKTQEETSRSAAFLVLEVAQTQPEAKEPVAVLKGAFKLLLPLHSESFFGGTESGVSILEYIPAPLAGRTAEESCFTPRSFDSERGNASVSSPFKPANIEDAPPLESRNFLSGTSKGSFSGNAATVPTRNEFLTVVPHFTNAAESFTHFESLGPTFALLPPALDRACESTIEAVYHSADQALHDLPPLGSGASSKMFWGSFLPLSGDAISGTGQVGQASTPKEDKRQGGRSDPEEMIDIAGPVPMPFLEPSQTASENDWSSSMVPVGISGNRKLLSVFQRLFGSNPRDRMLKSSSTSPIIGALGDSSTDAEEGLTGKPYEGSSSANNTATEPKEQPKQPSVGANSGPYLLSVAFHPMADAQGSGFKAKELLISLNHVVTSHEMYENLIQDCRLGRVYVQLSSALAYYTLFYWDDVEYHRFLPFPLSCMLKYEVPS